MVTGDVYGPVNKSERTERRQTERVARGLTINAGLRMAWRLDGASARPDEPTSGLFVVYKITETPPRCPLVVRNWITPRSGPVYEAARPDRPSLPPALRTVVRHAPGSWRHAPHEHVHDPTTIDVQNHRRVGGVKAGGQRRTRETNLNPNTLVGRVCESWLSLGLGSGV